MTRPYFGEESDPLAPDERDDDTILRTCQMCGAVLDRPPAHVVQTGREELHVCDVCHRRHVAVSRVEALIREKRRQNRSRRPPCGKPVGVSSKCALRLGHPGPCWSMDQMLK